MNDAFQGTNALSNCDETKIISEAQITNLVTANNTINRIAELCMSRNEIVSCNAENTDPRYHTLTTTINSELNHLVAQLQSSSMFFTCCTKALNSQFATTSNPYIDTSYKPTSLVDLAERRIKQMGLSQEYTESTGSCVLEIIKALEAQGQTRESIYNIANIVCKIVLGNKENNTNLPDDEIEAKTKNKTGGLVDYAENELKLAGLDDKNSDYSGMLYTSVMEIIKIVSKQGHSGGSIYQLSLIINKLLLRMPLTPLTGKDDEWNDISDYGKGFKYQNKRDCSVLKDNMGKVSNNYTGENNITFPYMPSKVNTND